MRTLVTGGSGFIGSAVVDRLAADGHQVTVVDDLSTGRRENLADALASGRVELAEVDLAGPELAGVVAGARPEVVYHLAAQIDVRRSVSDPLHDARVNVLGTIALANESQGQLRPGDRLVCYTDGLVEARNAAGEFLDRSVFERAAAADSLTAALDGLVELVDRHAGGRHDDDLALLALEYDPREGNGG